MFEEAEDLDHPYFRTTHVAEGIVRSECKRPWRIYRPGFVVGDSKTGYIDKIDGPYYFFKLIQKMRNMLPPWVPTLGIEGGRINIVPVGVLRRAGRKGAQGARRLRLPDQQCGPVDPARRAEFTRPLPRFRAHDAA
jgi:hypothetical protein